MSNIPIILINRDRLSYTRDLVNQLLRLEYTNITILDMDSTYEPLLLWYSTCQDIKVIRHPNTGHKALWTDNILKDIFSEHEWVCVSDSDIELSKDTIPGFIEEMICLAKDFRVNKAGLAIKYTDITNEYLRNIIEPIESRYWEKKLMHPTFNGVHHAPVDTTFCVVKTDQPFTYEGIRVGGIYTCRHLPWYSDFNNLSQEELYYHTHADPIVATGTVHYNAWRAAQV